MKKIVLILLLVTVVSQGQWVQLGSISTSRLNAVKFLNDSTGVAGGVNGIWKTFNGGVNWVQTLSANTTINSVCFIDVFTGFAVGNPGRVYKTTDGGSNWTEYILSSGFGGVQSVSFFNINTGVSAGFQAINRTSNSGADWYRQDSIYFQEQLAISVLSNGYGWIAGGAPTEMIKNTINYGVSWTYQNPGFSGGLNGVYALNSNTVFVCGHFGVIRRTTNGGTNWVKLDSLTSRSLKAVYFPDVNTGTVVGDFGTILHTINSGNNWSIQTSSTTNALYGISFINSNTGWAVGNNGTVIKTINGGVTFINPISTEIPNQFSLFQNYPNPFNPATKIKFALPKSSYAKLIVYDALGREVETIVNEQLKPGNYETEWDAAKYPSGVYFYKLITEEFTQTKKMLLIK